MLRNNFLNFGWPVGIYLLLLLPFLTSCDSNNVFTESVSIDNHAWPKDKIINFETEVDSLEAYAFRIAFDVRHEQSYPFKNLWLFIKLDVPYEEQIVDTIELEFMDEQGRWLENVHGSTIKESRHYYNLNVEKPGKGLYKVEIQQAMREEVLEGIASIGFRLEKVN